MFIRYNSRNTLYKTPFGAVKCGTSVNFNIEALDGVFIHGINIVIKKDGEDEVHYPMRFIKKSKTVSQFITDVCINDSGIYWYKFIAFTEIGNLSIYCGQNGEACFNSEKWYQLTVFDKNFTTPHNISGGLIYHIFVDRFAKGDDKDIIWDKKGVLKKWNDPVTVIDSDGIFRANDFYGGNFQGIIDKLDYLKDLGVTTLYFSPIFKSASNHRYDTGDYMQIDELLGSEAKFEELIAKAREYGIGIILDGVFNHTGADSLYFNKFSNYDSFGAFQGIKSPYYDWYYFIKFPETYACWWGITVTPTVNKHSLTYRNFILGKDGVVDKWTSKGIDGWRLDVVDELDIDFVYELRKSIKKINRNAVIIGEVWEDASTKVAYSQLRPYLLGKQLDGTMNYPYKNAILHYLHGKNIFDFIDSVMAIYENYPLQALNCSMNFLGTHDTVRAINSLASFDISNTTKQERVTLSLPQTVRDHAKEKLKLASVLQFFLPGIPTIYYGDEIGLEGYEDPINRKTFPWDNIDYDLLSHYQFLGKIRNKYNSCFTSSLNIYESEGLLFIERSDGKQTVVAIVNNTDNEVVYAYPNATNLVTNKLQKGGFTISKNGFVLLRIEK